MASLTVDITNYNKKLRHVCAFIKVVITTNKYQILSLHLATQQPVPNSRCSRKKTKLLAQLSQRHQNLLIQQL